MMVDKIKVIGGTWILPCPTGRHWPPHPDLTCDEADAWIIWRDRILGGLISDAWDQFALGLNPLNGTVFQETKHVTTTPLPPEHHDVTRALDILRPHLAWEPVYRR